MEFFVKYAATTLGFSYVTSAMILTYFSLNDLVYLIEKSKKINRTLDQLDEATKRNVDLIIRFFDYLGIILLLLSQVMAYFFLPISGAKRDVHFAVDFLDTNLKNEFLHDTLINLFFASFHFVYFISVLQGLVPMYLSLQCIFQIVNLTYLISNICSDMDCKDVKLKENEKCQKIIEKRLIFCIKYHQEITKISGRLKSMIYYPMLIQTTGIMILSIGILFEMFNKERQENTTVRNIFEMCLMLTIVGSLSVIGQMFSDEVLIKYSVSVVSFPGIYGMPEIRKYY
ncbi:uncharacterized protein LOC109599563 [Aethina tumida]|uniref:uncharacterized protein LOC109599563 n=1 Tax=Aethina tumida TaxID=116153 RepID=UPI0021477810|nr:uncharacterized protein LOC109599563 [Aethina tumida]